MNWATSEDPRELLRHAAAHLPRVVLCRVLCDVAETALPYCDDDAITAAVWAWDATRRWCRGETDLDEVEAATLAVAWAGEAAGAAWAAAWAAGAAWAAAWAGAAWSAEARGNRLHALAILVRLRLPYDPVEHVYALWRDLPVCAAMVREQRLCEAGLVMWDADCEAGRVPVLEARNE